MRSTIVRIVNVAVAVAGVIGTAIALGGAAAAQADEVAPEAPITPTVATSLPAAPNGQWPWT
ncbi:hypothetical protein AB0F81_31015 [Actinoplanes sp. NPDC024001]|uniref:hypothetical protein n=1 Tax=Actinoplanes sp. NPDC024001 TaxID=3154598 RepID=UPI0033E74434